MKKISIKQIPEELTRKVEKLSKSLTLKSAIPSYDKRILADTLAYLLLKIGETPRDGGEVSYNHSDEKYFLRVSYPDGRTLTFFGDYR